MKEKLKVKLELPPEPTKVTCVCCGRDYDVMEWFIELESEYVLPFCMDCLFPRGCNFDRCRLGFGQSELEWWNTETWIVGTDARLTSQALDRLWLVILYLEHPEIV